MNADSSAVASLQRRQDTHRRMAAREASLLASLRARVAALEPEVV